MTEIKTYCDHCKKQIDTFDEYPNVGIELGHKCMDVDLCTKCFDELWSIINNYCNKQNEH